MADMRAKGRYRGGGKPGQGGKVTEAEVHEIRQRYAAGGISQYELAREYGLLQPAIWQIIARRNWKHV